MKSGPARKAVNRSAALRDDLPDYIRCVGTMFNVVRIDPARIGR